MAFFFCSLLGGGIITNWANDGIFVLGVGLLLERGVGGLLLLALALAFLLFTMPALSRDVLVT